MTNPIEVRDAWSILAMTRASEILASIETLSPVEAQNWFIWFTKLRPDFDVAYELASSQVAGFNTIGSHKCALLTVEKMKTDASKFSQPDFRTEILSFMQEWVYSFYETAREDFRWDGTLGEHTVEDFGPDGVWVAYVTNKLASEKVCRLL